MSTLGVIAEFNPFHNGHKYFIEEARKISGCDYVIACMSGDFVQRGEPAIADKFIRTEAALLNGCDAVFEIPCAYASSSAEIFALAGIKLLASLGNIDAICFGSECGDIEKLKTIAGLLTNEPEEYKSFLKSELKKGLSFPVARRNAFLRYTSDPELTDILDSPNNILAIEYCKALQRPDISAVFSPKLYTVKRVGAGYSESSITKKGASATGIRKLFKDNEAKLTGGSPIPEHVLTPLKLCVPETSANILIRELTKSCPIFADDLTAMLYYCLQNNGLNDNIFELSRELSNSIASHTDTLLNFTELCETVKTKNLTYAGISRALLHCMLGITNDLIDKLKADSPIPYLRLLGLRKESSAILKEACTHSPSILITKLADAPRDIELLELDIKASRLYSAIVRIKYGTNVKDEYSRSPVMV